VAETATDEAGMNMSVEAAKDGGPTATKDRLLVFVHVPKTGGTSLQGVFQHNGQPVFNIRSPDQARAFLALPEDERAAYMGVFGHMPFGMDRYVDRPVTYITFLRHPVERVLSAYAHNLRHPEEPGADAIRQLGLAWTARPANFMCRFLAEYDPLEQPDETGAYWLDRSPPDYVPVEYLKQAKANLDKCGFIGLQEHYEDDVRALGRLPGHTLSIPPAIPRVKTGDGRIQQSDLTPEQLEAIRAANHLDIELYDYALKLRQQWGGPLRPQARTRSSGLEKVIGGVKRLFGAGA
jgi:hypothetical protein